MATQTSSHTNGHTNGHANGLTETRSGQETLEKATTHMTHEEKNAAIRAARFGYGPLAHLKSDADAMLPAFGGEFQPGLVKASSVTDRKFANPAPLGLSAFALTTFVLSLINLGTRGLSEPTIIISLAFGYGGLVQLLAGMWEMAVGNTFGATALSSYGGFWISFAILLTPGGFAIESTLEESQGAGGLLNNIGFFLMGWFIFTFILLLCTLKSTVAFFFLFLTLDLAFLMLAIGYLENDGKHPQKSCIRAGGAFGILAAFAAWYNALAGIADSTNSFFVVPVAYFPWSAQAKPGRAKLGKGEHDA